MPDLNELLKWSLANSGTPSGEASTPSDGTSRTNMAALHTSDPLHPSNEGAVPHQAPAPRSDLNADMLEVIMGKADSTIMKEQLEVAVDENKSVEDRVQALDNFEMLIELIDNANNISSMKLWEPLLGLLDSSEPEIVTQTCWVIGTAVQNNPKAQEAFHAQQALKRIFDLIYPSTPSATTSTPATRAKAAYALSASLKHWPVAALSLSANNSQGWSVLQRGLKDEALVMRRKFSFLISALVSQSPDDPQVDGANKLLDGLKSEGLTAGLVVALKDGDVEVEENAIRALAAASKLDALTLEQKSEVKSVWSSWGASGLEERGVVGEDAQEIEGSFA